MSVDLSTKLADLKRFWTVRVLVEEKSLRKASTRLNVTPSAVSQMITTMEENLGYPLFIKANGQFLPTERCDVLLSETENTFKLIEALDFAAKKPTTRIASLSLGTYESLGHQILPGLVRKLNQDFPKIKIKISVSRTSELLKMLRNNELCSAVLTSFEGEEKFTTVKLNEERFSLYASPSLDKSKLIKLPFGFIKSTADGYPYYLQKFLKQLSHKPEFLSDSFELIRKLAEEGLAVGILPTRVAKQSSLPLVEVNDHFKIKFLGQHSILLVSPKNCDHDENEYLATVLMSLFR